MTDVLVQQGPPGLAAAASTISRLDTATGRTRPRGLLPGDLVAKIAATLNAAATSQGSTPASSISSYTFDTTPAATVLGASHALRPVCPLIFLRGS